MRKEKFYIEWTEVGINGERIFKLFSRVMGTGTGRLSVILWLINWRFFWPPFNFTGGQLANTYYNSPDREQISVLLQPLSM